MHLQRIFPNTVHYRVYRGWCHHFVWGTTDDHQYCNSKIEIRCPLLWQYNRMLKFRWNQSRCCFHSVSRYSCSRTELQHHCHTFLVNAPSFPNRSRPGMPHGLLANFHSLVQQRNLRWCTKAECKYWARQSELYVHVFSRFQFLLLFIKCAAYILLGEVKNGKG